MPDSPIVKELPDILVFRSLSEISTLKFPQRLERMLLAVCAKGEISATIDVNPRRMTAGTVLVLRPGHLISDCHPTHDYRGFFITVSQDKLNQLFPTMHYVIPLSTSNQFNPIIKITSDEMESLSLIYDMFSHLMKGTQRPFHSMAMNSLCDLLFYQTLGIYASRQNKIVHKSRRDELFSKFVELLEQNFKVQRCVNYYAENLCVTPKHLSTVLKEISGKTCGEWIDQRVILEAKLLLRTTGLNIQEISLLLNFSNQSFFGKYFKHLTGVSPRDYRNKLSEL